MEVVGPLGIARSVEQLCCRLHPALDVGACIGEQGFENGLRRLLMQPVLGGAVAALNVSSRNVKPTPSVPPTSLSVAGVHDLPFIISANRASRTQMTLPSWAKPERLAPGIASLSLLISLGFSGNAPKARPKPPALSGRGESKEIDRSRVLAFNKPNLQFPHEAGGRHPEIIPHHDDALHPAAIALSQSLHELGVLLLLPGMEPLLELVEDEQHFFPPECPVPAARLPAFRSSPNCPAGQDTVSAGRSADEFPFRRQWPRRNGRSPCRTSLGSKPALTSDDLPQPDGP